MKTITQSIEAVADKRHSRLCVELQEQEAAAIIVQYLTHLESVHQFNAPVLRFIESIKQGYEVKL